VLSRANSSVGHEQEVMGLADTLVNATLNKASEEVKAENE